MDLQTCLKKFELVQVLNFATVDEDGAPQVRNISAIHYEPDALYFFTARGKEFCRQLLRNGRVQVAVTHASRRVSGFRAKLFLFPMMSRSSGVTRYSRNSPILKMSIRKIQRISVSSL